MLCLSNICDGFRMPSIVDIKIGFQTTYPWADEKYNAKNRCALSWERNQHRCVFYVTFLPTAMHLVHSTKPAKPMCRAKDAKSTQGSHGFRISGMRRYHNGQPHIMRKRECEAASQAGLLDFVASFVFGREGPEGQVKENGVCVLKEVVTCLDLLEKWVQSQGSGQQWRLISVSLLVVCESACATAVSSSLCSPTDLAGVRCAGGPQGGIVPLARCALIDFAHCFFGELGKDENFEQGVRALKCSLLHIMDRSA
jgi:hypothetical protein